MIVLSLFDGISCGQQALKELGVKCKMYLASEIDKKSIGIAKKNFPDTVHIGDVRNISFSENILKTEKGSFYIDDDVLLLAGSPCQGFSFNGKMLNFEDPRSRLYFNFLELYRSIKPRFFLLENVPMKQECVDIINSDLGHEGEEIDSSHFTAQRRKRIYWSNLKIESHPEGEKPVIEDIIFDDSYKNFTHPRISITKKKCKNYVQWDISGKGYKSQQDRAHYKNTQMCTIPHANAQTKVNIVVDYEKDIYRRLHPVEGERLQGLPDHYTELINISDSQRISAIGNGWNVPTVKHILKGIKNV